MFWIAWTSNQEFVTAIRQVLAMLMNHLKEITAE